METILYHGAPQGCAFGVIVALEWLCRPYRLVQVDLPGLPVPVMQAGGKMLRDCRSILRHIGQQKRYLLGYRAGTAQARKLDTLLDYLHEGFDGGPARMALSCSALDEVLSSQEWIDGCKRTVADAALVAVVRWAQRETGLDLAAYPALQRHVTELHADPAVFFADAIEAQRPAVSSGRYLGSTSLDELPLAA
ncbi:glutathione S-transferase family protein [Pseudoduganella sp. S-14]|jgi:glutathione S-transferase|uniref:glutathione S-transferase family protein n=1 Tax=Pseudoduganella sp. S-14 TaxID=3404065 RepID=UPI003CE881B2